MPKLSANKPSDRSRNCDNTPDEPNKCGKVLTVYPTLSPTSYETNQDRRCNENHDYK
jgi:hypothetical protein